MKKYTILNKFSLQVFILAFGLLFSCDKEPVEELKIDNETYSLNKFVWSYMDYFYLWNEEMPQDIDLKLEESTVAYFDKLIYEGTEDTYDPQLDMNRNGDRWSFITDDLQALNDYYNGKRESIGYFLYAYFKDDTQTSVVLVLAYVYNNSPASAADLRRGDIITEIDGIEITPNNVNSLLDKASYEITLGKVENDVIVSTDIKIQLTKTEYNLDPILKSEIYEVEGKKIGYLVYNNFSHPADLQLISEMEKFEAAGVDEFVLDLRYNPGGSVASAINLASMLVPKSNLSDIFIKRQYNNSAQQDILSDPTLGEDFLNDTFTDKAVGYEGDGVAGTSLPNLNLSRIYILTLDNTASSSELVINGLSPYMDVILVGERTYGKYVASRVFTSDENPNWAIQPIIFKSANSEGLTDYWYGFESDIPMGDFPEYGDFGYDVENKNGEPMLIAAIGDITGVLAKKSVNTSQYKRMKLEKISELDRTMLYDLD